MYRRVLVSTLAAVGLAGSVVVPVASASPNTFAFAKSIAAMKAHQEFCGTLWNGFDNEIADALASRDAGDETAAQMHFRTAHAYAHVLQSDGCEGA